MPVTDVVLPLVVCGLFGGLLAILELIQAFGKWIGRYWSNRYVIALVGLNAIAAAGVFAFLRYALGVESSLWLIVVTGLTFPTILRSRFTFYRPLGKAASTLDTEGFSLRIDGWYRKLQNLCLDELNSQIANERRATLARLRRCLTDQDRIAARPITLRYKASANRPLQGINECLTR